MVAEVAQGRGEGPACSVHRLMVNCGPALRPLVRLTAMSTAAQGPLTLTEPQLTLLRLIYGLLLSSGGWPVFQAVRSAALDALMVEPSATYGELSALDLVRPTIQTSAGDALRDDTPVSVSLRGLALVDGAEEDLSRFLSCVRYLADRAEQVGASSEADALDVTGEEIATALGLAPGAPADARLQALLQRELSEWSRFEAQGGGRWTLTVAPGRLQRFRHVATLEDYLAATRSRIGPAPASVGGTPAADAAHLRFATSVAADLPTTKDLLGYRPLVRALHGLLNDTSTVLPVSVAITAPWGAGKSSVMRQLQAALDDGATRRGGRRIWATVRFDAWKYERGERLWAALAKAIYSQPQRSMTLPQRLRFRVRLERRRRGWWATLATVLWPALVIAAVVLAIGRVGISSAGAAPAVFAGAAVTLGTLTRYGRSLANPFKRAIERHARRPDYEAQLGFTADADRDIRVLTRLLAPDDDHGLAIFVDDLDRCSSAHLVEIVEAMNQIFNSASDHRCVFVLGLDREIVTTNIQVAYASTVAQLRENGNRLGERFGLEFLAKLVQISVSLPEPTDDALETLLETITGNARGDGTTEHASDADVERVQADIQTAADETLASVASAAARIKLGPASAAVVAEATRRELAERIVDSAEVAAAEFSALAYLERNPRQIKRFHNAFRLQLYVANEDDRVRFDFTAVELIALAKWVVVRLRWPDLGHAIAHDPPLLAMIEAEANDELTSIDPALFDDGRLIKERDRWLSRPGVQAVMREEDPAKRLSNLELKEFLRVA